MVDRSARVGHGISSNSAIIYIIYIYIVFLIPRRNSGDQVLIRVGICLRGTLTLLRRSVDPRFVSIIAVSLVSKSDRFNLGEEISFYRDENC